MKRILGLFLWGFLLSISSLHAAESPFVTGTIVDIQQKAHTKVLYYLVNTPITRDDPYFEMQIQVNDKIYTGEYTPRHAADLLPEAWKLEAEVQVRIEKHSMFLKRPGGDELEFLITRRKVTPNPQPATPKK
jgi:hypothetical protein